MQNTIREIIEQRTSVGKYEEGVEIDDSTIAEIVRLASLSPSAYNLQNWRFVAVKSKQSKLSLQEASYGQPQVAQASVTFIVCGQLNAHKKLASTLQLSVDKNIMPSSIADSWVKAATGSHDENPMHQRDEAIRSASLAAMTLMFAAKSFGFDSGAMGGFDSEKVSEIFSLSDDDIPVMLITVGRGIEQNWAQKARKPIDEILSIH
ncbi:nitroreductase family protein [Pseudomonas sp. HK3]